MKYKVTFYCPDRHITYNGGRQPDKKGVGGGVNARIRLSQSLASLGHEVELICNCLREEVHRGVHYIPLDTTREIKTEILILTTSGDKLDISPVLAMTVSARLKILLIHGVSMPKGVVEVSPDIFYPLSNFVLGLLENVWDFAGEKQKFVSHRGVIKEYFRQKSIFPFLNKRDSFRLVYSGHPSKGKDNASGILENLRKIDPRYHLYTFGDEKLWGGKVGRNNRVAGVKNFGTVHQMKLARELTRCSFGIFIQSREEPFGQTMIEAMAAGCIPIASPVGAFQELVRHGENGFFVEGESTDPLTWKNAANIIADLQQDGARMEKIRENAMQSALDWMDVARAWEQHWDIVLENSDKRQFETDKACPTCLNKMVALADGLHCLSCGHFIMENKLN